MTLISKEDFKKASGLDKYGLLGNLGASWLMKLLKIDNCNHLYNKVKDLSGDEFFEKLLSELNISYEIHDKDIERIPKTGAFITVSNHPLGAVDGIILIKILSKLRPDFKMTGNFLLKKIKPIAPHIIAVNPFEDRKDLKSSVGGLKESLSILKNGGGIGFFPAGEVSSYDKENDISKDKPWLNPAIKLIKKVNVPVIPIYFHTKNSDFFYKASKINPTLQTALLPREMFSSKKRKIQIRIGKPITPTEQKEISDTKQFGEFLRKKTYILSNFYSNKDEKIKIEDTINKEQIINPIKQNLLEIDFDKMRDTKKHYFSSKDYELYLADYEDIPNVITEIGRLREQTFRNVGEGTNKEIDLDKYDHYYKHLILWDAKDKKIAGAYRMGLGKEIYKKYGLKGFYLTELFDFERNLFDMVSKSIEMGRAFVSVEYQKRPMPLFLLWRGIMGVVVRNPDYNYIVGSVSISEKFSDFSKSLMIEFIKSNYFDPYIAQYVRPKNEYKVNLKVEDKDFVLDASKSNLNKFDKFIDEIEPGELRLPVLIKKYIKQNAKLVAFNVDPKFNNSIDGLMYIKIANIPESTIKPVMEDFNQKMNK